MGNRVTGVARAIISAQILKGVAEKRSSAPRGFIIDADKSNYSHPRESGRKERGKITSGLIKFL